MLLALPHADKYFPQAPINTVSPTAIYPDHYAQARVSSVHPMRLSGPDLSTALAYLIALISWISTARITDPRNFLRRSFSRLLS